MMSERLTIKVLAAQKQVLQRMAHADGELVVVVVRRLIRAEAQHRGTVAGGRLAQAPGGGTMTTT